MLEKFYRVNIRPTAPSSNSQGPTKTWGNPLFAIGPIKKIGMESRIKVKLIGV